jgi:hypothetical protein
MNLRRRQFLQALLAMVPPQWFPGRVFLMAHAEDAPTKKNAALLYERAFELCVDLRNGDAGDVLRDRALSVNDKRFSKLLRKLGPALDAVRKAAAVNGCAWSRETLSSEDLSKGRLDYVHRSLVQLLCVSAERRAASGDGRGALDDLFAGLLLAHRVGTGGVFLAKLFEGTCEIAAFKSLGRILPRLDQGGLNELSRRLEALAAPEPASATMEPETRFVLNFLAEKIKNMGPVLRKDDWTELGYKDAETEVLVRVTGNSREALLEHLEKTKPAFRELARRLDLPRPECWIALKEFHEKERVTFPVAAMLVDAGSGVRRSVDWMIAYRAMARAAVELVLGGEVAFRAVTDPFGSGPFTLEQRGTGYLIRSALRDEESFKEAMLDIGPDLQLGKPIK